MKTLYDRIVIVFKAIMFLLFVVRPVYIVFTTDTQPFQGNDVHWWEIILLIETFIFVFVLVKLTYDKVEGWLESFKEYVNSFEKEK